MSVLESQLAPGLLIAAPWLPDPNFSHTAVFLMEHSEGGAMGLVVNRPLDMPLSHLLAEMSLQGTEQFSQPVLCGGPVAPSRGWVLHEADISRAGSLVVAPGVALNSTREVLEAIAKGDGPGRFHTFLGYSGWGPKQLEREISMGSWIPVPVSLELLFDVPLEERWELALRTNGIDPAMVMSGRLDA